MSINFFQNAAAGLTVSAKKVPYSVFVYYVYVAFVYCVYIAQFISWECGSRWNPISVNSLNLLPLVSDGLHSILFKHMIFYIKANSINSLIIVLDPIHYHLPCHLPPSMYILHKYSLPLELCTFSNSTNNPFFGWLFASFLFNWLGFCLLYCLFLHR